MAKVVVGLLASEQEFQQVQAKDARDTAGRLGLEVEVLFAEGNAVAQIQQLFRHIHAAEGERPVAIVVEAATGDGLERVARNATAAGIAWVLVNTRVNYVDGLRAAHPKLAIASIGTDQKEVGRIQARQCQALLPGGGRVLCVRGPEYSTVTADRSTGLRGALGESFDVRGVNGDWTEASGERAVASWLRLGTAVAFRPDVVVCQNDSMAAGAHRALARHQPGWEETPLLGCDGLPEGGVKMVAAGALAATIVTPSNTGPALELVSRWVRTGEVPPSEVFLPPRSHPPEATLRGARRS